MIAYQQNSDYQEAIDKRRWRGVRLDYDDGVFRVLKSFPVRDTLKIMGFKYNADRKWWQTDDDQVAAQLLHKTKPTQDAKDALRKHIRLSVSDATIKRAAQNLKPSDIDAMREMLTPAIAKGLRLAMAYLASEDTDKATEVNQRGFSKANTELGHTLDLLGVRTWTEALLARRLAWRYRKQLPVSVVQAIFPETFEGEQVEEIEDEIVQLEFTREQAEELVERSHEDLDAALRQIHSTPAYIEDGEMNPHGPSFNRMMMRPIAKVEDGYTINLCKKAACTWLEVA